MTGCLWLRASPHDGWALVKGRDVAAKLSRHRHREDGITIILRGLSIYQTYASPYWYARMRQKDGKYIFRSLKETSKIKARERALEEFQLLKLNTPTVKAEHTFRYYAKQLIDKTNARAEAKKVNDNYARTLRSFIENEQWGLLKHFGSMDIREIRSKHWTDYMGEIEPRDFTTATLKYIQGTFKSVLALAVNDRALTAVPMLDKIKVDDNPRSMFWFDKGNDEVEKFTGGCK
jgi:hypothetical protein